MSNAVSITVPSWLDRTKVRLRALRSKKAWPPWFFLIVSAIEKAGDLDFVVSIWSRVKPRMLPTLEWILGWMGEWGWIPGILWLGWLVVRSEKGRSPQSQMGLQVSGTVTPPSMDDLREQIRQRDVHIAELERELTAAKGETERVTGVASW